MPHPISSTRLPTRRGITNLCQWRHCPAKGSVLATQKSTELRYNSSNSPRTTRHRTEVGADEATSSPPPTNNVLTRTPTRTLQPHTTGDLRLFLFPQAMYQHDYSPGVDSYPRAIGHQSVKQTDRRARDASEDYLVRAVSSLGTRISSTMPYSLAMSAVI
jgi:hypothetical protein